MSTLPEPKPQDHAVRILVEVLSTLRTRDGIAISDALILERAKNAITALEGALEPRADLTEAAIAVAALLADPFDPAARAEARIWLTAWKAAQPARPSTSATPGAAVRS